MARPVPFESEEFNRKFTVSSAEPKFAFDVVTPDMMAWLLAEGEGWHFEISRNYTLVYRWRESHDVDETAQVLDLITGFYQHIPDVVASLHKLNVQPQPTPEQVMEMAKAAADGFTPSAPGTQVTAGQSAAASPEIAAALDQLRAMGIVVPPGTPVEVTTQVETVSPAALTAGHMTITGMQELGTSVGAGRMIQLDADVTPEGGSTYHLTQPAVVMPEHADRVKPGATLAVRIDPSNPAQLAIDWDAS